MRIVILLLTIAILAAPASAVVQQVNVLDQRTDVMPWWLFEFFAALTVITLIIGYRYNDEMSGFLALGAGFITAWSSRHIDEVSGISYNSTAPTVIHTTYQPDIATIFGIICFILAFANLVRLYVLSKKTDLTGSGGGVK